MGRPEITERMRRAGIDPARRLRGRLSRRIAPYHLTISPTHRFVWYRVAKVGTRSILHLLEENAIAHVDSDQRPAARLLYVGGRYHGYYKFAFVRNPWDRLVSSWTNKVVQSNHFGLPEDELRRLRSSFASFARWVAAQDLRTADRHIALMTSLIDLRAVDFVGRMETFEQDMETVCRHLGIEGRLAQVNASARDEFNAYYDPATRRVVAAAYAADIERFHYTFE